MRWLVLAVAGASSGVAGLDAQAAASPLGAVKVTGHVAILEKDNKPSADLADAVVYLEGPGGAPAAKPVSQQITISDKTFSPHVLVIPLGSTVTFPNHDPFDHNVFSAGQANTFDLGLYGRGEGKSFVFAAPGLVRIYCNVHPRMAAFVYVVPNRWYVQPGADGSFNIAGVPPGNYQLHVWHERAPAEVVKDIAVTTQTGGAGGGDVTVNLNARGFKAQSHKNKYGKDYPTNAGRERY